MTNKKLLTISTLVGIISTFLPWIGGPFGISLSGLNSDGILAMRLLVVLAILNIFIPEVNLKDWHKIVILTLPILSTMIMLSLAVYIGFGIGLDPETSALISIQLGFVFALIGNVSSVYFAYQRAFK